MAEIPFIGGIIIIPLLIYGLLVALAYWAYRNLSFVFDEGEFSLYSGIIVKKRVHVPYARVQSVNHHATVIQRIFGICTVAIDTAGGAANKAVRIPYVSLSVAERLRSELFLRKAVALEQMAGGSAASQQAPAVQQVPICCICCNFYAGGILWRFFCGSSGNFSCGYFICSGGHPNVWKCCH